METEEGSKTYYWGIVEKMTLNAATICCWTAGVALA